MSTSNESGARPRLEVSSGYQLFEEIYGEHFSIKNLPASNAFKDLSLLIIKERDSESFKQWTESILIAVPPFVKPCHSAVEFHTNLHLFKNVFLPQFEKLRYSGALPVFYENELLKLDVEHWELLSRRLGKHAMKYIFVECSVFIKLKGCCFLQIAGVSAEHIHRSRKPSSNGESNVKKNLSSQNHKNKATCRKRQHSYEPVPAKRIKLDGGNSKTVEKHKKTRRSKRKKNLPQSKYSSANTCGYEYSLVVPWYNILHKMNGREGISNKYSLNRANSTDEGANEVIKEICSIEVVTQGRSMTQWFPKMIMDLKPLVKELISNQKNLKYRKLIYKYCPVPQFRETPACKIDTSGAFYTQVSNRGTPGTRSVLQPTDNLRLQHSENQETRPLQNYSTSFQVVSFMKAVLLKVVPIGYLGSKHNRNMFLKNITSLVTMSSCDTLCLGNCMHQIRIKDIKWLTKIQWQDVKEQLTAKAIYWLVLYVLEILKGFFYITEMASFRYELFFYRHSLWNKIYARAHEDLVTKGVLKPVDEVSPNAMGVSSLRFIPKKRSVRPICIPKKNNEIKPHPLLQNQNLRRILSCLNEVLTYKRGAGQSGLTEVEDAVKKFRHHVCQLTTTSEVFYYVKIDVQNCFGSMCITKTMEIVQNLLKEVFPDQVLPQGLTKLAMLPTGISCSSKMLTTCDKKAVYERLKKLSSSVFTNCIVQPQKSKVLNVDDVIEIVAGYVHHHTIQVKNQFYEQAIGIVQGGILSSALCDLYYGSLDRNHLRSFLNDSEVLLLRKVDDYALITRCEEKAKAFLQVMLEGFPDMNCSVNREKVVVNFNTAHSDITTLPKTALLPFLGYLIDPQTLSMSVDYTRYIGQSVGNSLASPAQNPGKKMKAKVLSILKRRCTPGLIDLDAGYNANIVKNVYEMFLISAFRMHSLVSKFRRGQGPEKNPKFFLGVIKACSAAMFRKADMLVRNDGISFPLTQIETRWLCLWAFQTKLRKTRSYDHVVKVLRKEWLKCYKQINFSNRHTYSEIVHKSGQAFKDILP